MCGLHDDDKAKHIISMGTWHQSVVLVLFHKANGNDWITLSGSRKYPYLPHGRDWKFQRGGGRVYGPGNS